MDRSKTLKQQLKEDPDKLYYSKNYGSFKLIEYKDRNNILIEFTHTGYRLWASSSEIRRGFLKDPMYPRYYGKGYIGVGKYNNIDHPKICDRWNNMLRRVYGGGQCYEGVEVCEDWHDFQKFAAWFDENYIEGMFLDKDLFSPSVDVRKYSPDTCCFIPHELNSALTKARKRKNNLPRGVSTKNGKFYVQMTEYPSQKMLRSGYFDTLEEAQKWYVDKRSVQILQTINKLFLENRIEPRVFFRVIELLPNLHKTGDLLT